MSAPRQDMFHEVYVELFDEKGMPVMLMHRGDSWSYSQKGHSHTYFHAQSRASYFRFLGHTYTSVRKTAKIWWDPWQGGDGAIYSSIDGSGSGYPIAEVNNCSRVIKYVVSLGQRYSSYSLVDMRIHDINVVADLARHDPTAPDPDEPVECDGTDKGELEALSVRFLKPQSRLAADSGLDAGATAQQPYSTGPWPVLHIPAVLHVEDCVASFTIAIDILQYVVLETLSMLLPFENGVPIELIQTASAGLWDELLRVWGGQLGVFALSLRVSLVLLDIAGLVPIPAWIAAMTALYVAWAVLFACWVYAVVCAVDMELMSPGAAAAGFCVMGLSFMNFMGSGLSAQWKQGKEWYQKYLITTHPHWKQIRLLQVLYTIVTIAVKVSASITCIYLALHYAWLHVQLYGW